MGTLLFILSLGASALALAGLGWLALLGFRHGDRLQDAAVSAELRDAGQPDEPRPVVAVAIDNPSPASVMVGLSARRSAIPVALRAGSISVPVRTARRGLRADRYETVGVVPSRSVASFLVPVTETGPGYLLTAAIGQAGGRLRVHRVPVDARSRLRQPAAGVADWHWS
jgi:hypothetical protein